MTSRGTAASVALVTGASGFIGSHCLRPLTERGYEVHAVRATGSELPVDGITWHRADLLDDAETSRLVETVRPTHLLHLAWFATPGKFVVALDNFRWVQASLTLYRHFVANGGRRVVTAGSSYEYDWRYGYCTEALTPRCPDTVYGTCKKALDELADAYARAADLSAAWARIFFLYGPREHPDRLVSSVIRSVLTGSPAKCSHGEQIRDYLHVQDVADALVTVLDSDLRGAINIGTGIPITLKTIVLTIGEKLRRPDLIELGAIPARANDASLVVADAGRLTGELGWQPSFDIDTGLDQTIQWWREQGVQE